MSTIYPGFVFRVFHLLLGRLQSKADEFYLPKATGLKAPDIRRSPVVCLQKQSLPHQETVHPIIKTQNSTQKTAGRKSKQIVLDQTRHDHRKSGDRLITTKPLSTFLVMYSTVYNYLLSKLVELRVLTHTNQYYIITLTYIKPKHGTLPDPESLQINGYTLYLGDLVNTNSRGVCCYVNDKLSI